MIVALSIRSFVLIDRLDLEVGQGFTALTGETGAGKSIILDALGLVLGGPANRRFVRHDEDQASVTAEFALQTGHAVWGELEELDVGASREETLTLRRTLSRNGPSRAFINDQPVSAATLETVGEKLVEIHGQHSASGLMRPSTHRGLLDAFSGVDVELQNCRASWVALAEAREHRQNLEAAVRNATERKDWLLFAVSELEKLAPEPGEASTLLAQRAVLMQAERLTEAIQEMDSAISTRTIEETLSKAARAAERLIRIEGLEALDEGLAKQAHAASDAIERVLIELTEAQSLSNGLKIHDLHDAAALERIEARLLALRGAARKFEAEPDMLAETLETCREALSLCEAETGALDEARAREQATLKAWDMAADTLSVARRSGAHRLERAIMKELKPLHLGRVKVAVRFDPIGEGESGANGKERAEFEVETNPGSGFGSLRQIASGGELARFSLALKCALAHAGVAQTLIFDEADQGVGGAVAAAIGERLQRLSKDRQVFAITHSPQVASSAHRQWRVRKQEVGKSGLVTAVHQLDDGQRLEEIARMLSGSSITDEARAAASKLLEAA